eukprot:1140196-Pelagomonas_calceolata.AAC.1
MAQPMHSAAFKETHIPNRFKMAQGSSFCRTYSVAPNCLLPHKGSWTRTAGQEPSQAEPVPLWTGLRVHMSAAFLSGELGRQEASLSAAVWWFERGPMHMLALHSCWHCTPACIALREGLERGLA